MEVVLLMFDVLAFGVAIYWSAGFWNAGKRAGGDSPAGLFAYRTQAKPAPGTAPQPWEHQAWRRRSVARKAPPRA